jgi:DNA-nicking Smr family endonuclease
MSRRPAKNLTDEDRVLWSLVARSATPLRGKRSVEVPDVVLEPEKAPPKSEPVPQPASKRSEKAGDGHAIHALDRPTHDKLARGRMPIEGRVDLHGLTQDEAHALLYSFLSRAHAGGVRYVLVITGKGSSSGGDGVLRRSVPAWLSTPLFRPLVSSHDHAARNHGGAGALYVRLRRMKT